MKKFIISLALLLTLIPAQAFAGEPASLAKDVHVTFYGFEEHFTDENGQPITPIIVDGTAYLPAQIITGLVGFGASWDKSTNTVEIINNGGVDDYNGQPSYGQPAEITVELNSTLHVTMDGDAIEFPDSKGGKVDSFVYNDNIYLPIRPVCDLVDVPVAWDASSRTIVLGKQLKEVKPAAEIPAGAQVLTGADLLPASPSGVYKDGNFSVQTKSASTKPSDLYFAVNGYRTITFTVTTSDIQAKPYQAVTVSGWDRAVDQWIGTQESTNQDNGSTKTYTADLSGYGAVEISVGYGQASNAVVTNVYLTK